MPQFSPPQNSSPTLQNFYLLKNKRPTMHFPFAETSQAFSNAQNFYLLFGSAADPDKDAFLAPGNDTGHGPISSSAMEKLALGNALFKSLAIFLSEATREMYAPLFASQPLISENIVDLMDRFASDAAIQMNISFIVGTTAAAVAALHGLDHAGWHAPSAAVSGTSLPSMVPYHHVVMFLSCMQICGPQRISMSSCSGYVVCAIDTVYVVCACPRVAMWHWIGTLCLVCVSCGIPIHDSSKQSFKPGRSP